MSIAHLYHSSRQKHNPYPGPKRLTTGKEPETQIVTDKSSLTKRDSKQIEAILSDTEALLKQDGLMFDGDPASPEAIESILSAMKIGMEMAKQKNKEKYTPKKYKKD